jgi:lipopolysaccharide export system protein LptC
MQASYRLYPLIALGVLAGASYWLEQATRVDEPDGENAVRTTPDFVAGQAHIVGYGKDGAARYRLDAETIAHFPAGDTIQLQQPRLLLRAEGSETQVAAERAEVSAGGEQIDFSGAVRVRRTAVGEEAPLTLASETLTVWPETHRARSDSPVDLAQGRGTASALGLRADNLFGTLELVGKVRAQLPAPHGSAS